MCAASSVHQYYRFGWRVLGFAERRISLVLLFALGILGSGLSQNCTLTLTGEVVDEHDSSSLEGSTIYLMGQGKGVYADSDGRFTLDGLCAGEDSLRVTHIGCEAVKVYVTIGENTPELTVFLEHHAELLDGIEVHAHRNRTASSDIGMTMSGEQLDRVAGEDFATVVERLPGVRQISNGANVGRPVVDGLGGSRLQIVQGSIALASQDWGDEHALEIDPFAASSVQLARSGNTVRYGASTTGASLVLDDAGMPVRKEISGKGLLHGKTNSRGFGGGVQIQQRLSNAIGYRVQFAGSDQGDSRAPDYVLSNTGGSKASGTAQFYYTDSTLQLDASYRGFAQETGILRAAHIGNTTDLQRALESDRPLIINPWTRSIDAPRQVVAHHWFAANAGYQLKDDAELNMSFSYQFNDRKEYDIRRGGRSAIPSLDLALSTTDVRVEYKHPEFAGSEGQIGVNGTSSSNRNDPNTGTSPFIPFYNTERAGAFFDERLVKESLTWEFSGRVDVISTSALWVRSGENGLDERTVFERTEGTGALSVGLAKYFDEGLSIRARLAYASRTANPAERFANGVHHALGVFEVGDSTLNIEHGLKGVIGFGAEKESGVEFHASAFAQVFSNFIYQQYLPDPILTIRGAFPVVAYQQQNAFLAGVDLDFHAPIGPLQLDLEASYLYGSLSDAAPLPDVAPWQLSSELSYSRTTNGRFKDWRVAASLRHVGEQNRAPTVLPRVAPAAYTLAALDASTHLALGSNVLGVHLTVLNLFDTEYRDYLDRLRYYAARPGRDIQLRLLYDF